MHNSGEVQIFNRSLKNHMLTYGVDLSGQVRTELSAYYDLLLRWNERLHLVAPCSPDEFATRHVLESLILVDHLPHRARVADVGSGAGLPIIPCLIVRSDVTATLIESSRKKSVFLREALKTIGALDRATILSQRFEQTPTPDAEFITCRALDDFSSKLKPLIHWAPAGSTLLLFGGDNLRAELATTDHQFNDFLLPGSDRRFLFELRKACSQHEL